jgi:hypothetical protein
VLCAGRTRCLIEEKSMKEFAVKCEKTTTFYINVQAENEWQAQHRAEYVNRRDGFVGYSARESEIKAVSAIEVEDTEE